MSQNENDKSAPDDLLSAWMKASTDFWGSVSKMWLGVPLASEHLTRSDAASKSGILDSWEPSLKMWYPILSTLREPSAADALLKGISGLPEIVLKMARTGWDGYSHLQRQGMEKVGRIGKHAEAHTSDDLEQKIFRTWTDIYEKEFKQLLAIPQPGPTSLYFERMNRAVDKFNVFQVKVAGFLRLLSTPVEKSFRTMQERIGELAKEGRHPKNQKEYYSMWLKILEGHYMTLLKSPEYTGVLSDTLNAMTEFLVARQQALLDLLQGLPVATKREMDELSKQLYVLNKKVKDLTKKLGRQ